MKRLISLLLAMVLLLGLLCGCGKDTNNNALDIENKDKAPLKSEKWTDGKIADGVYTNECLNLTFQIPEGWIQASEEETRTILNADPNDASTVYDVLLGTMDTSAFMALACLDLRHQIGGATLTEDEFLNEMKDETLSLAESLGASFSNPESVSICGREYRGVIGTTPVQDRYIQHARILLSRLGKDKMVMLIVRAPESQLDYYMAHFTDDPSTIPALPEEATPEPTTAFTRGEYNGNSYTNELIGLRFDAPEDWIFSTDRELAALIGLDPESIGDEVFDDPEAVTELFAEQQSIFDMAATAPDSSAVIQLALENLSAYIGGTSMTEDEYAEILAEQLETTGYSYEIGDLEQQELAGKTFTVMPAVLEAYGICQYLYIARVEDYMLVINFTGVDSSVLDYTDCFSKF